jgi:hypothetical protein
LRPLIEILVENLGPRRIELYFFLFDGVLFWKTNYIIFETNKNEWKSNHLLNEKLLKFYNRKNTKVILKANIKSSVRLVKV